MSVLRAACSVNPIRFRYNISFHVGDELAKSTGATQAQKSHRKTNLLQKEGEKERQKDYFTSVACTMCHAAVVK